MFICIYTHIYTYIYIHTLSHTHTHLQVNTSNREGSIQRLSNGKGYYIHTRTHMHTHTHTFTHTHIYIHIYSLTHAHTFTGEYRQQGRLHSTLVKRKRILQTSRFQDSICVLGGTVEIWSGGREEIDLCACAYDMKWL